MVVKRKTLPAVGMEPSISSILGEYDDHYTISKSFVYVIRPQPLVTEGFYDRE